MIQAIIRPEITSTLRSAPNGTLGELQEVVTEASRHNHDFIVSAEDLFMDEEAGTLVVRSSSFKEYHFRPLALSQMAARLGIPGSYLQKCPKELAADNLNFWLYRAGQRKFMLRCNQDEVRAVLSHKYSPVDNTQLVRWLAEGFEFDSPLRYELTEEELAIQFVGRKTHTVDGTGLDGQNDVLHNGIAVRNSEVGLACVELTGLIYRVLCLNGLILAGRQNRWKRRHIGDTSLGAQVQKAIIELGQEAANQLEGFGSTSLVKVPDMPGLFERITQRHSLTEAQSKAITSAFTEEPGDTLYHAINAITRAGSSPTLHLTNRRTLQETGGRLMQMSATGKWAETALDKNGGEA